MLFIVALTVAAVLIIISPAVLQDVIPEEILNAAKLDEFPLLGTCIDIAKQLISSFKQQQLPLLVMPGRHRGGLLNPSPYLKSKGGGAA